MAEHLALLDSTDRTAGEKIRGAGERSTRAAGGLHAVRPPVMIWRVPTPVKVTQQYDAPATTVFALFKDPDFVAGRLAHSGAPDATVVSVDPSPDGVRLITRQSIPASVLPSMVASMMQGDPVTERTEEWRGDGDSYVADFSLVVKGAPAAIRGTMTLAPAGNGSTLVVNGQAIVPIPMFGSKIESVIAEQIGNLLSHEETYTRSQLPTG